MVFIEGLVVTTGHSRRRGSHRDASCYFRPLWLDGPETVIETTRGNLSNAIASMDLLEARNVQEPDGINVGEGFLPPVKSLVNADPTTVYHGVLLGGIGPLLISLGEASHNPMYMQLIRKLKQKYIGGFQNRGTWERKHIPSPEAPISDQWQYACFHRVSRKASGTA